MAKLAIDHWRNHGRPFRVAIDVSIWCFQSKTFQTVPEAHLGSNYDLRVLYYRMTRLMKYNIQALFVFDGPNRPSFKRDKKIYMQENRQMKMLRKMLKLFGYPQHTAPGEAEAECVNLEKSAMVDAIFSEDVDTLMFGGRKLIRSTKDPWRIILHDLRKIEEVDRLTPEGMIMIALLSGGDYVTRGVLNCGPKIAAQAARAGYGIELLKAYQKSEHDQGASLQAWRDKLQDSLRNNTEKIFTKRHGKIRIPNNFPDQTVLEYYINPVVSSDLPNIDWNGKPDVKGLAEYAASVFKWDRPAKFIKTFATSYLTYQVLNRNQSNLIKDIHGTRSHHSVDNEDEIRVSFIPVDVISLPYETITPLEILSSQQDLKEEDEEITTNTETLGKASQLEAYDPNDHQRVWILKPYVEIAEPKMVNDWTTAQKEKQIAQREKQMAKNAPKKRQTKKNAALMQILELQISFPSPRK